MRPLRSRPVLISALATAVIAVAVPATAGSATTPSVTISVDRTKTDIVSHMATGATLTQYTLNKGGNAAALSAGTSMLSQATSYQMQTTYQDGTLNPEPSPGVYKWASLDHRVALIKSTGAVPVLDLFGVPDWMRGGVAGQTNWTTSDVAPLPSHYADFAALARSIALRYPSVHRYIVWSENKGFYNKTLGNYDYVAYTTMYNLVYDALKLVNPTIQVGGPYQVLEGTGSMADTTQYTAQPLIARNLTFLKYWLKYKHGADFLVVDRKLAQRADLTPYTNDQLMALTPWFQTVSAKLHSLTPLPIWYAESYFRCQAGNEDFMAAGLASMLLHQLRGGTAASLRWSPERQPSEGACPWLADNLQNLFTSTQVAGGGKALPSFYVYRDFKANFSPGTQLYQTTSSSAMVEALASATKTLLINKMSTSVNVTLNGTAMTLSPYEVALI